MKPVALLCIALFVVLTVAIPILNHGDTDEIPQNTEKLDLLGQRLVYDFIVVGAGASGCIVAARLAKETNKTVLLLEGGHKGTGQRDIGGTDYVASKFETDPVTGAQILGTPLTRYDLPLFSDTIRQANDVLDTTWNISNIGYFYNQSKAIGGNQVANGAGWFVPQKKDFDLWNLPGFNSTEFFPYFTNLENATSTNYTVGRGLSGPTNIEFGSFLPREQSMLVDAAKLAGYPNGGDFSNGNITEGYYYWQFTTKQGIRQTSSITFLAKALETRPNLDFRTSAAVTRVLFSPNNTAIGVEYSDRNGNLRRVYARKEVILSAGTLQTAKILFNSGIGPLSILTAFNKPQRVVNEIVGQKISNQQRATVTYSDPTFPLPNFYTLPAASVQFARNGQGAFNKQTIGISHRVSNSAPYPEIHITPFAGGITPTDPYGNTLQIWVFLTRQIYANATLNLTSSDPLDGTFFVTNSLVVPADAEKMALGMLEARRIMTYWNSSTITEISPGTNYTTVEQLVPWIQANPFSSCHYYSSAPMGTDPSYPTDPRMRVRGVQHLRVVGPASAPTPVFFGMQALAMALGEKGVDLIKEDHNL
eukprot:Phypoly_transcript_05350.p1 GENE.Phypoly_transcript_05350~~Phypoly_transcript_05350.p1  ORF type:complete len:590 (+),score=77.56 Phypoly_transcript_05350:143-1912(+)